MKHTITILTALLVAWMSAFAVYAADGTGVHLRIQDGRLREAVDHQRRRAISRYDTDYSEDKQHRLSHIKIVPDLWINGKLREVDFNTWPVAESPVMTLKDGILRAEQGEDRVEVDWSGELPRISRR